jgi:multiple sugar transport system ATP-binding protein
MVLLGPSGCGKSTALRMIAGLETVTDGELRIGDTVVNDVEAKDRDIAMVFQSYALYPHMTVRENIEVPLKTRPYAVDGGEPRKLRKSERADRVVEAARILGLDELLDRKPGALSGAFSGWAGAGLAEAGRVIVRPFGWEGKPRRPGQRAAAARRISRNRWA